MVRAAALLLAAALVPALSGCAPGVATSSARSAQHQDTVFAALAQRYLDGIASQNPSYATAIGDHRFDDKLPDMSAEARARGTAFARALLAELGRIDRARLSRENQVDAALLDNALRYSIWADESLRSWAWDPQIYNEAAGGALYSLAARDFAPWETRLRSAMARMEAMPALLAQARVNLVPARVPEIFATTVAKQNGGIVEIVEEMLTPHLAELNATDSVRFDSAFDRLKAAVDEHQVWLDRTLVPQAKGDFRLGPDLYDSKLAFALASPLDRAEIKRRASETVAATREEMYAIAREVLAGRPSAPQLPSAPTADQQQRAIEAALELAYAHRPSRSGVEARAAETLAQATAFVRERGLVTVPDAPVRVITMPKFQQGVSLAYCDSPGPLEKNLATFYAISPIPAEWTDAQATSFLREYNDYAIHDLTLHEAIPGHYLQLAHANGSGSTLRAVLASGPFIEGWANYGERVMAEAGYLDGDPLFRLIVLKLRLRVATNALLDIGVQAEGMSREQAMDLMMRTAFQQEREAAGKWVRASLTSAQLPTYFVGYSEHVELRREAERRRGAAFDLKAYHDELLSHGSPPVRYARALMFGEPIDPFAANH
ncbi:MAG TPA: DUF885 domain-containing protein [Allosphingosinicella sp.]